MSATHFVFLVQRRNKWICALKTSLKDVSIYGPSGAPPPDAGPTQYTLVPWEEAQHMPYTKEEDTGKGIMEPLIPKGAYQFQDRNAVILDDSRDVFNESSELHMTNPRQRVPPHPPAGDAAGAGETRPQGSSGRRQAGGGEMYEMSSQPR